MRIPALCSIFAFLPLLHAGEDLVAFLEGASTNVAVEAIDSDGAVQLASGDQTIMDDLYQIVNGSGQAADEIAPQHGK